MYQSFLTIYHHSQEKERTKAVGWEKLKLAISCSNFSLFLMSRPHFKLWVAQQHHLIWHTLTKNLSVGKLSSNQMQSLFGYSATMGPGSLKTLLFWKGFVWDFGVCLQECAHSSRNKHFWSHILIYENTWLAIDIPIHRKVFNRVVVCSGHSRYFKPNSLSHVIIELPLCTGAQSC